MPHDEWGKIKQAIYDSSIFFTGPVNRSIFMDSVVLASSDNIVHMSLMAFAKRTGWNLEQVKEAASVHMAPDPDSRTKEHDGRRWMWVNPENENLGFLVVNRETHKRSSPENIRQSKARWARANRAKEKAARVNIITDNITVMPRRPK